MITNAHHFNIKFEDLGFEAQEHILETLAERLKEHAKTDGEGFLAQDWHDPKPQTWQEAYIRTYAIDCILWAGYENREEERPDDSLWNQILEDWATEKAEQQAKKYFAKTEVEVIV